MNEGLKTGSVALSMLPAARQLTPSSTIADIRKPVSGRNSAVGTGPGRHTLSKKELAKANDCHYNFFKRHELQLQNLELCHVPLPLVLIPAVQASEIDSHCTTS